MEISPFSLLLPILLYFSALACGSLDAKPTFSFSFEGFGRNRRNSSKIALYGDAETAGFVVRATKPAVASTGRIVFRKPIMFLGTKPGFSTNFSFSISLGNGGSLAFFMAPGGSSLESKDGDQFGRPLSIVAVNFVTSMEPKSSSNQSGGLIEIDVGGGVSAKSSDLSVQNLVLSSGEATHCWIDYEGGTKRIEVRLSMSNASRLLNSLVSCPVDLSRELRREAMLVGISSMAGNSTQNISIHSWSFAAKHGAPYLIHSEPLDPHSFVVQKRESPPLHPRTYPWGVLLAMVFAAACGALVTFFVMFVWFVVVARRPVASVEYPAHPVEAKYEKIVLVAEKGADCDNKK